MPNGKAKGQCPQQIKHVRCKMDLEGIDLKQQPTGALSHLSGELGMELKEVTDCQKLQNLVKELWCIIDDIDEASDIAKSDESLYRNLVHNLQERRHEFAKSDGYLLFVPN